MTWLCSFHSSAQNFQWLTSYRIKSWLLIVTFQTVYSLCSAEFFSIAFWCPSCPVLQPTRPLSVPPLGLPLLLPLCSLILSSGMLFLSSSQISASSNHTHELFPDFLTNFSLIYPYGFLTYLSLTLLFLKRIWGGLWANFKVFSLGSLWVWNSVDVYKGWTLVVVFSNEWSFMWLSLYIWLYLTMSDMSGS